MKATGFVRRIDDLGRVVIPKEIRKTLRIKEGTPLEIFTDREGEIILKKYSPIGELNVFAKEYAEALAQSSGMVATFTYTWCADHCTLTRHMFKKFSSFRSVYTECFNIRCLLTDICDHTNLRDQCV